MRQSQEALENLPFSHLLDSAREHREHSGSHNRHQEEPRTTLDAGLRGLQGPTLSMLETELRSGFQAGGRNGIGGSSAGDIFDIATNPDHILLFFYIFLLFRCVSKAWLHNGGAVAEKVAEAQRRRDDLEDTYEDTLKSSQQMLLGMFESSAYVAEWNFQTRARNFEKFVTHMKAHPRKLLKDGCDQQKTTRAWCHFLLLWFEIFEQCSVSPVKEPNRLTNPVDVANDLRRLSEAPQKAADDTYHKEFDFSCETTLKVLAANEVNFKAMFQKAIAKFEYAEKIQARMRESPPCWIRLGFFRLGFDATGMHGQPAAPCDSPDASKDTTDEYPVDIYCGFLHVTLLSQAHFLLIFTSFVSIVLICLELWLDRPLPLLLLAASDFFLVFALVRISDVDEFARLSQEVRQLQQASALVNMRHQKLDKFCRKLRKLDHLWRTRTLPGLELMGELCTQIQDLSDLEDRSQFLGEITEAMRVLINGFGYIDLWLVDDNESAEFLELAGQEMHAATQFIVAARKERTPAHEIVKRVQRIFGVLIIRVNSARKLTNKTTFGFAGEKANPYVTVKTNQDNEMVTQTIESQLNPVWDEEFCIPVAWNDDILELHVWSNSSSGVNIGEDPSLGYVHIPFRSLLSGQWHKSSAHLKSVKKGTEKESELHFEVFFAARVQQLYDNE